MNIETVKKPSETTEEYWLYARNETTKNNNSPGKNCGKWLIFENVADIDEAWEKIRNATESGTLGFASKVSTMKDKEGRSNQPKSQSVICVYTYDWTDKTDVFKVRKELTDLGFTKKLPYKSDEDTLAGYKQVPKTELNNV